MTRFEKFWIRLFASQTFSHINTPAFLKPSHPSYLPAYEDGTECSETSAYKIQAPGITQKKAHIIQNTAKVWNQKQNLFENIVSNCIVYLRV